LPLTELLGIKGKSRVKNREKIGSRGQKAGKITE
jgi:hypothetical protein